MTERNTHDNRSTGELLAKIVERLDRLELSDGLTRVHPITGDDTFVGTVISTPTGVPVFVASEAEGLELPVLTYSSDTLDITGTAVGLNVWESRATVVLPQVLSVGVTLRVDVERFLTAGGASQYDGELRLQSRNEAGTVIAASNTHSFTNGANGGLILPDDIVEFAWNHTLDITTDGGFIDVQTRTVTGPPTRTNIEVGQLSIGGSAILNTTDLGL